MVLLDQTGNIATILRFNDGSTWRTFAPFRVIFEKALALNAAALAIAHNHPSGIAAPSQRDCDFTRKLAQVCEALEIGLVDHWIVTAKTRFSFRENGLI